VNAMHKQLIKSLIYRSQDHDRIILLEARKMLDEARAALQLPRPSTFLGKSIREDQFDQNKKQE
jgi:hypothetical protein